jgi:ABC-type Fe3+-hydroxamate transport system substrate-binding protein
MKIITNKEFKKHKIKILPCVNCGSENIKIYNREYSNLNVIWGTCVDCKREVKINPDSLNPNMELIAKFWNYENDPKVLLKKYQQEISELQKKIDKLL